MGSISSCRKFHSEEINNPVGVNNSKPKNSVLSQYSLTKTSTLIENIPSKALDSFKVNNSHTQAINDTVHNNILDRKSRYPPSDTITIPSDKTHKDLSNTNEGIKQKIIYHIEPDNQDILAVFYEEKLESILPSSYDNDHDANKHDFAYLIILLRILVYNELDPNTFDEYTIDNIGYNHINGTLILTVVIGKSFQVCSSSAYLRQHINNLINKHLNSTDYSWKFVFEFLKKGEMTENLWKDYIIKMIIYHELAQMGFLDIKQIGNFQFNANKIDNDANIQYKISIIDVSLTKNPDILITKIVNADNYLKMNLDDDLYDYLIMKPAQLNIYTKIKMLIIIQKFINNLIDYSKESLIQNIQKLSKKIESDKIKIPRYQRLIIDIISPDNKGKLSLIIASKNTFNISLIDAIDKYENKMFKGEFLNNQDLENLIFNISSIGDIIKENVYKSLKQQLSWVTCTLAEIIYPNINQNLELNQLGINPFSLFEEKLAKEILFLPCKKVYRTLKFTIDQIKDQKIQIKIKNILTGKKGEFKKLARIDNQTYLVIYDLHNGDMIYLGDFDENLIPSGSGFLYSKDYLYKGELRNKLKHGDGKYYDLIAQGYYDGEFIDDKYHGKGTEYYHSGSIKYQGTWVQGFLEGEGIHIHPGGLIYEGQFKKGQYHGEGRILFSTGICHMQGHFVDGKKNGVFSIFNYSGEFLREAYYELDVLKQNPQTKKFIIKMIDEPNLKDNLIKDQDIKKDNRSPINQEYNMLIYQEEIDRLQQFQWLNSKNINFFVSYLREKHLKHYYDDNNDFQLDNNLKKILYFPDTIFAILTKGTSNINNFQYTDTIHYQTIPYQGYGFLIFDIFDRIIFIVNLNNSHWCLAEINTEEKDVYKFIRYDMTL